MLEIIYNKDEWPKIGLVRFVFYTAFILLVSGTSVWGFDQLSAPMDFVFFALSIMSFLFGYFSLMVLFAIRANSIERNPLVIINMMGILFLSVASVFEIVRSGLMVVLMIYLPYYVLIHLILFNNKSSDKLDTPKIQSQEKKEEKEESSLFLQRLRQPILLFTLAIILIITFLLIELDLGMDKGLTLSTPWGCFGPKY